MLSGRQSLAALAAQVGIALACIISATVLAAMGKVDAAAVTAILGGALGLAGATAAQTSQATTQQPQQSAKVTTPQGVTVTTNGALQEHEPTD